MLGFLIAAVAGYLTPQLEDSVGDPIVKMLRRYMAVDPGEKRLVTFMVLLLAVAVLAIFAHSGSPFWLILGAIVGYFGPRLFNAGKKQIDAGNGKP
ncbi:hypothetical protein [Yoonia sediminilitoris]|uniref:Uncharacterized protein n=1 Tax=Yoonia sediminilitoris TaxID=1286148 RepID=A0A2T6KDY2_9RHOB|nr:hypothetical protein [Yoonia sediminilitoris]PUB13244.1 hypothetical protein C8N45_108166 [Yoonia sediminilitoris]RCW94579.1 hypothetical protein DFP92_108167 [Yoonia sediminilitoris]